jgi:hypothetical protein
MEEEKSGVRNQEQKSRSQQIEKDLVKKACKAYGIEDKYVVGSAVRNGTVTIVTNGGAKVTWKEGDEVGLLDPIRVDGIIRKKMKPITGIKK